MTKGWKKTLVGFAAMAAVASTAQLGMAASCGDVDNNGSFQVGDCVNMFDIIAGPPDVLASPCGSNALQCGDLNGDGISSVGDAIVCINNISAATTPVCATPPPATCPAVVSSALTQTTHWGPSGCTITLDGTIFVNSNVLLKIDPGVTVKGKASPTSDPVSALIFRRDSRIDAQGTVSNPIVFTSDEAPGSKTVGAWGGLVINGRGTVNVPGGEGLAEGLTGVPFGGNAPNESSGTLTFTRIEFAGRLLSLDNELNALTMNALGRGTTIHHVEALRGKDDGFEWFGGNNFIHHVISAANNDDNLDTQLGTQGGAQYALVVEHKASTDANPHSNGFEADNNENGFDLLPRSSAKFCNVTAIGFNQQTTGTGAVAASGGLLRRGTGGQIANSIIMDFKTAAFKIDDNATLNAACSGGALTGVLNVRNSIIFGNTATGAGSASGGGCTSTSAVNLFGLTSTDPQIDINARTFTPPFTAVPLAGSPAGTLGTLDCSTIDPLFDNNTVAPYIGAFPPGGVDWATGAWVSYDLDG